MAVQLQPAEIELRIVTDEAERQLAAFREQVKMEGEVGDFQAGEGTGQAPEQVAERLKEVKEKEEEKSWGQRPGFFKRFAAEGPPPRVHTEIMGWARDKVWEGIDYVHGRRVVESANNLVSGITKSLHEGRVTGVADALLAANTWALVESGSLDDIAARTISGAARVGLEVGRLGALYGPRATERGKRAINKAVAPLGEITDPQTGEPEYDASFLSNLADTALGLATFDRETIIDTEAAMKASVQTLSQMTNMGVAMMRTGLGNQMENADVGDFVTSYASRAYDWNKMQEKMRMEAEINGTRFFIEQCSNNLLDRLGFGGSQLE